MCLETCQVNSYDFYLNFLLAEAKSLGFEHGRDTCNISLFE